MRTLGVACIMMTFFLIGVSTSSAADLKVDEKEWNTLSKEDKKSIEDNLKRHRLMLEGDKVVGVPGPSGGAGSWNPVKDACKFACDASAVAAAAACTGSGPTVVACVATVNAAREVCRSRC